MLIVFINVIWHTGKCTSYFQYYQLADYFHTITDWEYIFFLLQAEFASIIHDIVGGKSHIIHKDAMEDDPQRRKPDITRANHILGWQPLVSVLTTILELNN